MSNATIDWTQPQEVSTFEAAFGSSHALRLMPPMADIPDEFTRRHNPYVKTVNQWFFRGLDPRCLRPNKGIDGNTALRHLESIMHSFEPQHEHKTAAVAYLMSLWFDLEDSQ